MVKQCPVCFNFGMAKYNILNIKLINLQINVFKPVNRLHPERSGEMTVEKQMWPSITSLTSSLSIFRSMFLSQLIVCIQKEAEK